MATPSGLPAGSPATSTSARLWAEAATAGTVWAALHHPFVRRLADGTLPPAVFRFYIAQDAAFLAAFAAGYEGARAAAREAGNGAAVDVLTGLGDAVAEELRLHAAYAAAWGVPPSDLAGPPAPATAAYTAFLEGAGNGCAGLARVAAILAAMAPCSRLYGFLGCALAGAGVVGRWGHEGMAARHPFADWIETYSSPGYLAAPAAKEALLDLVAGEVDKATLASLYHRAMALELRFFTAALGEATPSPPPLPPPRALVVDFDETLTSRDTTPSIIAAVTAAAAAAAGGGEAGAELESERAAMTAALVRLYAVERAALFEECFGPEDGGGKGSSSSSSTTPSSSFDPAALARFTARLSAFDRAANGRAVEAGILSGAPAVEDRLRAAAGAAVREGLFRPGSVRALRAALAARTPVAVMSVSWSAAFVVAALETAGVPALAATQWEGPLRSAAGAVAVYANDLATAADGATSTGALLARCQCAEDKEALFAKLAGPSSPDTTGPSIYVGDAPSDLAALLAADVGIVVGASPALDRALAGVGGALLPLAAVPSSGRPPAPGTLYTTADWAEVAAFTHGAAGEAEKHVPPTTPASTHPPPPPRVLTIAGSDSGGGAGIQADLKTCAALGVYGATAITAITVQNSGGVAGVHAVPPETVAAQMEAVLGDIGADALKTGMLPTAACVAAVADVLERLPAAARPPLVLDPVLVATSGDSLAAGGVGAAMVARLFPLATVVTPNLVEAAALLGRDVADLESSLDAVEEAAAALVALGPAWALVKGGHAAAGGAEVVDVLHDGMTAVRLAGRRVDTPVSHGTGCSLAAALAAGLARGLDVPAAAAGAKAYVAGALAASAGVRLGGGPQWAMHHAHATSDWSAFGALPPPGAPRRRPTLDLRVYAVTDPALDAAAGRSTAAAAAAAAAGGATAVQVRDKSGDPAALAAAVAAAITSIAGRAALLVNDRVDVALATGADGAHVGQSDLPAPGARAALGPGRLLGVSVKTVAQALAAQAAGADYLGAGAVAGTATKDTSVIGLAGLGAICEAVSIPVVAIGGVGPANAAACIEAGAAGVAVVSAVFGAGVDTVSATAELRRIVDGALEDRRKVRERAGGEKS